MLHSYPCNTFIITEWRRIALDSKEILTRKVIFVIMELIKETEQTLGKIHKRCHFPEFCLIFFSAYQKTLVLYKIYFLNHLEPCVYFITCITKKT